MYLVTGGWSGSTWLSSTETLIKGGSSWTVVGELPRAVEGLRAVSIDNTIVVTGDIIINNTGR